MTTSRFPDFFIIGAPKCGTTSLFEWLRQHPDTYLEWKEPNFLSHDVLDVRWQAGAVREEVTYLARLCPPEAGNRTTGEATPKYLYSDIALARLTEEAQQVRLIVLLRNPVDLAVAMHAQNLREGYEFEPNFARAWARGPRVPGERITDYRFWGRPGARLKKYLSAIGRDRILVMLLEEEMRHDPAAAHARALAFLGLPPQRLEAYVTANPRRTSASPRLQAITRLLRRRIYAVLEAAGIRTRGTGLLALFDRLNRNRHERVEVSAETRARVAAELGEDARCIAALLGRERLPWPDFDWSTPSQIRDEWRESKE